MALHITQTKPSVGLDLITAQIMWHQRPQTSHLIHLSCCGRVQPNMSHSLCGDFLTAPRAGPGVERIGRTPPPLAQSVETWPIGVRLVCRELRPVSLEERILVIERVGCGRHATHYFGLNFS